MPRRHYHRPLILLAAFALHCFSFHRPSEFEKGLKRYQRGDYPRAADHFHAYWEKHPNTDTVLYYLQDCYYRLGQHESWLGVLDQLACLQVDDINVYLPLIGQDRQQGRWSRIIERLCALPPSAAREFNRRFALTRRFYAELACGAGGQENTGNPLVTALTKGYLNLMPDGHVYADDTLTLGHLIMLLDRFLPAEPPRRCPPLQTLKPDSYLYFPYLRLVERGIIEFDPALAPDRLANPVECAQALRRLKDKGYFQ